MRNSIALVFCFLLATVSSFSAETQTKVPLTEQAVRYERIKPVFQSKEITKERGDALLTLLDGGRALERPKPRADGMTACWAPPHYWMGVILADGSVFRIGVYKDGAVQLSEGYFVAQETVQKKLAQWVADFDADLRREVLSAPRPCAYPVGVVEGTDTLSGIARLFYGDARKWPRIYEANKSIIKNPNLLSASMVLTIPDIE